MPQLSQEQIALLKKYVESYQKSVATDDGKQNLKVHREHQDFFSNKLSEVNIDKIDEKELREIYKNLWASNIWSNKDWSFENKLLRPNGLPKIKEGLKELLYGNESIDVRFDNFREKVQGFGPSSISEILHFVFPDKYCLWNDKPKTVLPFLKIDLLPDRLIKYNLKSGSDYVQCIEVLELLKNELKNFGFKNPDYIDVDCVLWHVFNLIPATKQKKVAQTSEEVKPVIVGQISSHEEAEYYLLELGKLLGYSTYTVDGSKIYNQKPLRDYADLNDIPDFAGQRDKNSAREIDVLWFDEDENPKFCLEVEHTTDVTKGLHRLLQLKQFNVTFVIVSDEDRRSKFETEMKKSPFRNLGARYKFISYLELLEFYQVVINYRKLRDRLLGTV